jgi:hypothetical protein
MTRDTELRTPLQRTTFVVDTAGRTVEECVDRLRKILSCTSGSWMAGECGTETPPIRE